MTQPILHTAIDRHKFDLWCEDEWLPHQDKNYVYESDVIGAFLDMVRPGDVCIDAGANVGYHTMLLSRLVGDTGAIFAFEPDPTHFAKLEANIRLNAVDNIRAFPHALWSAFGNYEFWSVKGGGYSSLVQIVNWNPTKLIVPTVALDDVIDPAVQIRLIKIDCEGAEEKILQGAKKTLARTHCVVMEFNYEIMHVFGSSDRSIRDYMDGLGFDFFALRRDGGEPLKVNKELTIIVQGDKPKIFNGMFVKR